VHHARRAGAGSRFSGPWLATDPFQCAKTFVNRKAIDVVDRALTVSGGAVPDPDNGE
jgi:hypothetical protein